MKSGFYLKPGAGLVIVLGFLLSNVLSCTNEKPSAAPQTGIATAPAEKTAAIAFTKPASNTIKDRIATPVGFRRAAAGSGSFAEYLSNLSLKPGRPPVLLHNGKKKRDQEAHFAVIDIDVGKKDLQQCADAVIRLRAEYLFQAKRFDEIHFNFTSGDRADFTKWAEGFRPAVIGNSVTWMKKADPDTSYKNFRKYLDTVFMYAGTASLAKELNRVNARNMRIGDVFIRGGFPGHAVIIVDMAEDPSGDKVFLLAQSYMPAQDIHILKNPSSSKLSPWYCFDFSDRLVTPEWEFSFKELYRFPESE